VAVSYEKITPYGVTTNEKITPYAVTTNEKITPYGVTTNEKITPYGVTTNAGGEEMAAWRHFRMMSVIFMRRVMLSRSTSESLS